jgi:hypothetical protein
MSSRWALAAAAAARSIAERNGVPCRPQVQRLLLDGANVNYAEKKGKYTALIKAARMQRTEVVKVLLDNKARVRAHTARARPRAPAPRRPT